MRRTWSSFALLLAAMVWGLAFVAQTAASSQIGPFTFNGLRTPLAALVLTLVIVVRDKLTGSRVTSSRSQGEGVVLPRMSGQSGLELKSLGSSKVEPHTSRQSTHEPLTQTSSRLLPAVYIGGALCGVVLFVADNLQQYGITIYPEEAAASGRAGFITATYVVMVAIAERLTGRKLHPLTILAVGVCVVGMYLLCLSGGFEGIYIGDGVVLVSAIFYTAHLMVIDRYAHLDPLKLTCIQFYVAGALAFICMLIFEHPDSASIREALIPLLYAGIFSSGVGYTLQTVGQRHTPPAVAAVILSLESVFAALAGWAILGEVLLLRELIGCALVFAAVILAQIPGLISASKAYEHAPLVESAASNSKDTQ